MLTRLPSAGNACLRRVPAPVRLFHYSSSPEPARSCIARVVQIEKFVGCNCYYLLEKATDLEYGGRETIVEDTLEQIRTAGFTVVRTWGFNSDPSKPHPLQNNPQAPDKYDRMQSEDKQMEALGIDPKALKAFDKLLELAHSKGLKLMICLTNSLADYGGMPQFVRWAGGTSNDEKELRRQFWSNSDAKAHCKNYITFIVTHTNKLMQDKGWNCVHSWDICNEPRIPDSSSAGPITQWVEETASWVKQLDPRHLVTVGSEGFWAQADANETDRKNPYGSGTIEGCDWLGEAKATIPQSSIPALDFVCIHPYADNWNHLSDALSFNEGWITGHVAACKQLGKPLVVQEYNLPADIPDASNQRRDYFNFVQTELLKQDSPLVGAMVWMVGDPSYPGDKYMIHPGDPDWVKQVDMCKAVNRPIPT